MISITSAVLAILISVVGVGLSSYKIGVRRGAAEAVQVLIDEGYIEIETDEE